jgi:SAM-dependent methyltransferase
MSKPIIKIPYDASPGLIREQSAHRATVAEDQDRMAAFASLAEVAGPFQNSVVGAEVIERVDELGKTALRILDIGVGLGASSLVLASKGHLVTCVEPSSDYCEWIAHYAEMFGLRLTVVEATAEALNRLDGEFDVCLFNASLHHCDDPLLALRNCYGRLRPGGTILLINEPVLKIYRTKTWFYRMLREQPLVMGHYGGNEHTYYYGEYRNMLSAAGFTNIADRIHVRNQRPRQTLDEMLQREIDGHKVYSDHAILIRFIWFLTLARTARIPLVGAMLLGFMKHLSLITVTFSAQRN